MRHVEEELVERAERVAAEELVLVEHQPLRADALVRGREPVVPDERHPLDQRARGPHHPVEPPEVVLAPGVVRVERMALVVVGRGPDELLGAGVDERGDRAVEPLRGERRGLARPRAEAGAPEQPLGLRLSERALVHVHQPVVVHQPAILHPWFGANAGRPSSPAAPAASVDPVARPATRPLDLIVAGRPVRAQLRESRRARHLRLVVRPGRPLEVTVPRGTGARALRRFLDEHSGWIIDRLDEAGKHAAGALGLAEPGTVVLAGERLRVVRSPGTLSVATRRRGVVRVTGPDPAGAVERWYRREARRLLESAASRESARLGLTYARVAVRDQRTRWGSCSAQGTLSFSWRLAVAPPEILDYVVVHELLHLREHNHSRAFWGPARRSPPGLALAGRMAPRARRRASGLQPGSSGIRLRSRHLELDKGPSHTENARACAASPSPWPSSARASRSCSCGSSTPRGSTRPSHPGCGRSSDCSSRRGRS